MSRPTNSSMVPKPASVMDQAQRYFKQVKDASFKLKRDSADAKIEIQKVEAYKDEIVRTSVRTLTVNAGLEEERKRAEDVVGEKGKKTIESVKESVQDCTKKWTWLGEETKRCGDRFEEVEAMRQERLTVLWEHKDELIRVVKKTEDKWKEILEGGFVEKLQGLERVIMIWNAKTASSGADLTETLEAIEKKKVRVKEETARVGESNVNLEGAKKMLQEEESGVPPAVVDDSELRTALERAKEIRETRWMEIEAVGVGARKEKLDFVLQCQAKLELEIKSVETQIQTLSLDDRCEKLQQELNRTRRSREDEEIKLSKIHLNQFTRQAEVRIKEEVSKQIQEKLSVQSEISRVEAQVLGLEGKRAMINEQIARKERQLIEKTESEARAAAASEQARTDAEEQARAEAEALAQAQVIAEAKEQARIEMEARAKVVAEVRAKAEEQARIEAEAQAAKEQAMIMAEAQEQAKIEAETQAKAKAEEQSMVDAETRVKAKKQAKIKAAEAQARAEAQIQAQAKTDVQANADAQAKANAQAKADAEAAAAIASAIATAATKRVAVVQSQPQHSQSQDEHEKGRRQHFRRQLAEQNADEDEEDEAVFSTPITADEKAVVAPPPVRRFASKLKKSSSKALVAEVVAPLPSTIKYATIYRTPTTMGLNAASANNDSPNTSSMDEFAFVPTPKPGMPKKSKPITAVEPIPLPLKSSSSTKTPSSKASGASSPRSEYSYSRNKPNNQSFLGKRVYSSNRRSVTAQVKAGFKSSRTQNSISSSSDQSTTPIRSRVANNARGGGGFGKAGGAYKTISQHHKKKTFLQNAGGGGGGKHAAAVAPVVVDEFDLFQ